MKTPIKATLTMVLTILFLTAASIITLAGSVYAEKSTKALIENAVSAAPQEITQDATIKTMDGKVLREGTNGCTCYPETTKTGPMCNQPQWDKLLGALMKQEPVTVSEFSVSYMLAGEGGATGVSNTDPFAAEPTDDNDWIKEGPHLMILVPDQTMLEGLSTNTKDPVYVMWKGTPYAHIMVKVATQK